MFITNTFKDITIVTALIKKPTKNTAFSMSTPEQYIYYIWLQ